MSRGSKSNILEASGFILKHPAMTPMPEALRLGDARERRRAVIIDYLKLALKAARRGESIATVICDGTADGWHARMALNRVDGADWDCDEGSKSTRGERVARIARALAAQGVEVKHGGGWRVSHGVSP